jgi:hypothetical protein
MEIISIGFTKQDADRLRGTFVVANADTNAVTNNDYAS